MLKLNFGPAAARVGLVLTVAYVLWGGGAYHGLVLFWLNALSVALMVMGLIAWFAWRRRRSPFAKHPFGTGGKRSHGFAQTPLDGAILFGLGAAAVSAIFSIDPGRSAAAVWLGAVWAGVYWVTVDGLAEGLSRKWLGRAIYLSGLVVVAIAVWQVIAFWRDWLALAVGLPEVSFRVSAPNPTAMGLNFTWPLLLAEMVENRRLWLKILMGLTLAGAAVGMFYTSSRGGWLGTGAGVLIFAAVERRTIGALIRRALRVGRPVGRVAAIVGGAIAGGVGVVGAIAVAAAAARSLQHASHGATLAEARGWYWEAAWATFLRSPVTGQGLFTFASAFLPVWPVPPTQIYNQAHGVIHNLLAETGLLGLAAAALVLIVFVRALRLPNGAREETRGARGVEDPRQGADAVWQTAALAALGAGWTHGLFETPYVSPAAMALTAWMAAMVMPVTGRGWVNGLLMIPVVGLGLWSVWAYQPLHQGIELGNQGQWPAAAARLNEAVRRDPLSTFAKFQAAYAAQRAGDPARAIELYQSALRREPGYSINWANLAAAQWAAGNQAAALDALSHARSLAPPAEVYSRTEIAWRGRPLPPLPLSDSDWLDVRIAQALGGRRAVATLEADRGWLAAEFEARRLRPGQIVQLAGIEVARGDAARARYLLQYAVATRDADPMALHFLRGDLAAAEGDLAAAAQAYTRAWPLARRLGAEADGPYGPGTSYGWLVFIRESLRPNLAPELVAPPYPAAFVERLRTLAGWYRTLGQAGAAQAVEEAIAGQGQ